MKRNRADEEVFSLLAGSPQWTRLQAGDSIERDRILACLAQISSYDISEIQAGVAQYIAANTNGGPHDLDHLSKVFVLNRYLFNVPQFVPADSPTFGAWRNPIYGDDLHMLWPLSFDHERRLSLTGVFSGYSGEPYRALEEFDYFLEVYGLRHQGSIRGQ